MTNRAVTKKQWSDLSPQKQATVGVVGLVQLMLLAAALIDIRRRPAEQIKGSKRLWTLVAFINFVGPIAYFVLGRKRGEGN
jgi:hypothetical protein